MEPGSSLSPEVKSLLKKQQYAFVGSHSAVKVCGWTKKAIRGEGVCYKEKFYGIKSHRCVQMSVAVNFCDMNCVYCWRDRNNFPFKEIDEPKEIIKNSVIAQRKLLEGFGGYDKVDKTKFKESSEPWHFAISLTGEMLYYPKLSEFIKELHSQGFSSFLVSNGQCPEKIAKLEPPTQLYISIDATDEETHKKICRPSNDDSWDKLMRTLDVLRSLKDKTRTTLRLTVIKGMNDHDPEGFVKLFERADPHFIEVKGYMFVGASRQRLFKENMPRHDEVRAFAELLCKNSDYKIIDEQEESRVVLLMKADFEGRIMQF